MLREQNLNILEVGLRDGLQNLPQTVPTALKLQLLEGLIRAGCTRIQVASFVNGNRIPQMSDAEDLAARLPNVPDVSFSALVLNEKGVERAFAAGIRKVEASFSTTETHSQKNVGLSLRDTQRTLTRVLKSAGRLGMTVRGGLQCVWGCVYEGIPPAERIEHMVATMTELGVDSISLADSTGMARPDGVSRVMERVLPIVGSIPVSLHLHNTLGRGYINMLAGLKMGIRHFDTSFGGLGGCPAITGAKGNIATEEAVQVVEQNGYRTGIDIQGISQVSRELERLIGPTPFGGALFRLRS